MTVRPSSSGAQVITYGKIKSDTALRNAQDHFAAADVETAWAQVDTYAERFLSGTANSIGGLALLARLHLLRAHAAQTSARDLSQIDWQSWRTGLELRLLDHRGSIVAARDMALGTPTGLSGRLHLALGLVLTGRAAMVPALLRDMPKALPTVLDRMNIQRKPGPVRFGILGQFMDQYGSPVRHASLSPVPADVPTAIAQRLTYSTSKGAQGNLLPAPEGDLIPLELIWFNTTLPEPTRDPQLTAMARAIAATRYPQENPRFVDLDIRLTSEAL